MCTIFSTAAAYTGYAVKFAAICRVWLGLSTSLHRISSRNLFRNDRETLYAQHIMITICAYLHLASIYEVGTNGDLHPNVSLKEIFGVISYSLKYGKCSHDPSSGDHY